MATNILSNTLKLISALFVILILVFILFIVSLKDGIKFNNLSLFNINISKLYIKYDKKLIVKAKKFVYNDKNSKTQYKLDTYLIISKKYNKYNIIIKNLYYYNNHLMLKADLTTTKAKIKKLLNDKEKHLTLNNVIFSFDKNLSLVKAKQCNATLKADGGIYFTFKKPSMSNVNLDNTKVAIVDNQLILDLYSKDKIDRRILDIVKYYGVDLPVTQYAGKNNINAYIVIPFDERPIIIRVKVNIDNASLKYDKYKFDANNLNVIYKDHILHIKSNYLHTIQFDKKIDLSDLKFKLAKDIVYIDTNAIVDNNISLHINDTTNLKNLNSTGKADIKSIDFNKIKIVNQNLSYKYISKNVICTTPKFKVSIPDHNITLLNFKLNFKNNKVFVDTNIKENNNTIFLSSKTNLDNNSSKGNITVKHLSIKDINVSNQKLNYDYSNNIATINANILKIKVPNHNITFSNLFVKYNKNIVTLNTNIKEQNNTVTINSISNLDNNSSKGKILINNFSSKELNISNQKLNYDYSNNIATIETDIFKIKVPDYNITFENLFTQYNKKIILLDTNIKESNNTITLQSKTNLENNISNGVITINNFEYPHYVKMTNQDLTYKLNFGKKIILDIKEFGLKYKFDLKKYHTLYITKLNNILKYVQNIKVRNPKKHSTCYFYTIDGFENNNLVINDLNITIDKKLFDINKTSKKETKIKLHIKTYNDTLEYNNTAYHFDSVISHIINKNSFTDIFLDKTNKIKIIVLDKFIKVDANELSAKSVEKLLHQNRFKDGNLSLNLQGTFDKIHGSLKLNKTTVKDVRVLNNLITFINTTPAYFEPLLILPTLYRLNQTSFDLNGYYIKKGEINFIYDIKNKNIKVPLFYTKSTMADFKGHSFVDIKNDKLKAKIDIIFLKDYSKVINSIPLVGYIILGKDGNFETSVDINGTLEKQDFQTHTLKDTTVGLFHIVKRTVTLPFLPFMDNNTTKENNNSEGN